MKKDSTIIERIATVDVYSDMDKHNKPNRKLKNHVARRELRKLRNLFELQREESFKQSFRQNGAWHQAKESAFKYVVAEIDKVLNEESSEVFADEPTQFQKDIQAADPISTVLIKSTRIQKG